MQSYKHFVWASEMDVHITQGRTRFFAFGMFLFFLKIPCVLAVFHHMTFLQILQVDRRSLKITKCDQGTGSTICGEKKKPKPHQKIATTQQQ